MNVLPHSTGIPSTMATTKLSYIPHMTYQSILISIFVLAEPSREEQGVDMVPPKFGDRNFSTFLAIARDRQPKKISKYGQYIYQIAGNFVLDTNLTIKI